MVIFIGTSVTVKINLWGQCISVIAWGQEQWKDQLQKNTWNLFRVMKIFYILIVMMATFAKTQIVYLMSMLYSI